MPNLQLGNLLTAGNALLAFPNKYSFNFDGSNDYLDCGTSLGNSLGTTTALTLSIWVKNDNSSQDSGVFKIGGTGNTAGNFTLSYSSGVYYLNLDTNDSNPVTAYAGFSNTDTSSWHHIVAVYNGTNAIAIYFDGSPQSLSAVNTPPSSIDFTGNNTLVGQYYNQEWDGLIDEVGVWDVALDSNDITSVYNNGKIIDLSKSASYGTDRTGNLKLWLRCGDKALPEEDASIARQDFYTDFDGTDDHIAGVTQSFTGVFSVSMWIRPNNVTDSGVGILGTTTGDSNYIRQFSQNVAIRIASAGATYGTGNVLVADEWIHLAITRDSSDALKWYVNGDYTGSSATQSGTFTFNHFARSISAYFNGAISNLALFSTTLDAQTISQMGKSRFSPVRNSRFSVVDFDGSNDFINISSSLTPSALTFTTWIATVADSSYRTFIQCGDLLISKSNGNKVHVNKSGVAGQNSTTSFVANEWTHIAITADSSGTKVYRNGVLDLDGSAIAFTAGDILIGKYSGGQFTSGSISSVAYYSSVKSAEEVYALYSKGITYNESAESGLVGYWRMGDDTSAVYPTIADSSSNSNDGTITNGALDDIVQQMVAGYDMGAFESNSEELGVEKVDTGDFTSTVGWTQQTGWNINTSTGTASFTGSSLAYLIYSNVFGSSDTLYKIEVTIDSASSFISSGIVLNGSIGNWTGSFGGITSAGSYTIYKKGNTTSNLMLWCNSNETITLSNISVKEVLQSEVSDSHPAIIDVNEPVLGVNIVDNNVSARWISEGTNSDADITNGVRLTYGNNATGNYVIINDALLSTSGLTVGQIYKTTFTASYSGGSSAPSVRLKDGVNNHDTVITTTATEYEIYFKANSADAGELQIINQVTDNVTDIINWEIKEVRGNVGTMTNQNSADLVYSSVLPDQSFLAGVNSAYNFIDLDGSNEYIQLTGNSPSGSFTISAWVFDTHASGGDYSAIYSANNVTIWFGVRNNSSGFVRLHINGSPYVDTPSGSFSSPSNQWLHLVGSWDGTNAKIYINGVSQTLTTSGTPSNPSAQANPTIGINDSNFGLNQWTGYLANVAVWDKALSDDDTLAIYNSGRHYNLLDSYSDNMISYHTMGLLDAKTGLSDVGDGTIYDRSGNSNHGTATNSESADLKSSPNAESNGYAKGDTNRSTTTP